MYEQWVFVKLIIKTRRHWWMQRLRRAVRPCPPLTLSVRFDHIYNDLELYPLHGRSVHVLIKTQLRLHKITPFRHKKLKNILVCQPHPNRYSLSHPSLVLVPTPKKMPLRDPPLEKVWHAEIHQVVAAYTNDTSCSRVVETYNNACFRYFVASISVQSVGDCVFVGMRSADKVTVVGIRVYLE